MPHPTPIDTNNQLGCNVLDQRGVSPFKMTTRPGNDCYSLRTGTWPIEIVDLPSKNGDFPVTYVKLPEGDTLDDIGLGVPGLSTPMHPLII